MNEGAAIRPRIDLATARHLMEENELDCLIVMSPAGTCHVAGARISVSENVLHRFTFTVLPREDSPCLIVSEPELWLAEEQTWIQDIRTYDGILSPWRDKDAPEVVPTEGARDTPLEALVEVIAEKDLTSGRLGIEEAWLPHLYFNRLSRMLPSARLVGADRILKRLHWIKTEEEVDLLTHANVASAKALEYAYQNSHIGDSEISLAAKVSYYLVNEGMEIKPWSIGSGPKRARRGHPWASDKRLGEGDIIHADPKGTYKGYQCDVVRMACVGDPSPEIRGHYQKVHSIHFGTIEACRAGMTAHNLYERSAQLFSKEGLEIQMSMAGYSIGADLGHDPHLGDVTIMHGNHTVLEPGMTMEIGTVYDTSYARWHIEDVVLITEHGARLLSDFPPGGQYLYVIK